MSSSSRRRLAVVLAVIATSSLVLTGCAPVKKERGNGPANAGTPDGVVTVYGSITGTAAELLQQSWADWEEENDIQIRYSPLEDFESQIQDLPAGIETPDLAIFSQPETISRLIERDLIQPLPQTVEANVKQYWSNDWTHYMQFDGVFRGAPLLASIKGLIWYSPKVFKANRWNVPKTLTGLHSLTTQMREKLGTAPWCAGFAPDEAAGWPVADLIEDMVLREAGPVRYDQWVDNDLPFSDPIIEHAFASLKEILVNPKDLRVTFGDTVPIASTPIDDVVSGVADGTCLLTHASADFEQALTDPLIGNTTVGPNKAVWAFLMPSVSAGGNSVTGGGQIVAAFSNDSDTIRVQEYLSSPEWANSRVKLGGVVSANNGVDPANASTPILTMAIALLQDQKTTFRFDGSQLMPKAVGEGSFPLAMVHWVNGRRLDKVLSDIDKSWPSE